MQNEMLERDLPPSQAHDLEAWKKGVEEGLACRAARCEAMSKESADKRREEVLTGGTVP